MELFLIMCILGIQLWYVFLKKQVWPDEQLRFMNEVKDALQRVALMNEKTMSMVAKLSDEDYERIVEDLEVVRKECQRLHA